jgi:hypothetical protein
VRDEEGGKDEELLVQREGEIENNTDNTTISAFKVLRKQWCRMKECLFITRGKEKWAVQMDTWVLNHINIPS